MTSGFDTHSLLEEPIHQTPEERARAAAYCIRRGARDVLGMLGLGQEGLSGATGADLRAERRGSGYGDAGNGERL